MHHLTAHDIPFWGPATHLGTTTASVYLKDPDNNQLEFVVFDFPEERRTQLPLSQHMERPNPHFAWDTTNLRAIPKDAG
jgi:hypothetical protein